MVFGGPHVVGIQVALCDGSVRFVQFSVDPDTWLLPPPDQRQRGAGLVQAVNPPGAAGMTNAHQ